MNLDSAPRDRFCDVVMEGGVTSGIIYASAMAELSKHYRFRSIGGSSIGAFAAALAAAAEYSRRHPSRREDGSEVFSRESFDQLGAVPDKLAKEDLCGKTLLQQLFKPQQETRRLFEIFLAALGHNYKLDAFLSAMMQAVWQYKRQILIAVILTSALALGPFVLAWLGLVALPFPPAFSLQLIAIGSWGLALLIALIFAVVLAMLFGIARDLRRGLVPNGFGLCRGWSEGDPNQDLAGFLHESIQQLVGRDPSKDPPLTFKELWDAPGAPTDVLGFTGSASARRSINLEIYATNLAHGRPYRFPIEETDGMGRLFFRPEEMADYFPDRILKHLLEYGRPYRKQNPSDPDTIEKPNEYFELPREHLPIAVAARMALSFPLLISAVPLWAIDYEPKKRNERELGKCWMSDGGLCSNFPIHLFDSFVPKWPTFGISLQTRSRYWESDAVWLPDKHYKGAGDSWNRFTESKWRLGQLKGFLQSLWMAAWHWNDMTMMRMPGVRDRVVRVLLKKGQGGVNIKMSRKQIIDLAEDYGQPAALEFVKKFANPGSVGWQEHRWVRLNRLLISLREQIECFGFAADLDRHALPLNKQIDVSGSEAPLLGRPVQKPEEAEPSEKKLSASQMTELKQLLAALSKLESGFSDAGNYTPYKAVPRPAMRVRHPT